MALTIALLVSLIAAANAGYVWVDENEHKNWSPFEHIKMPHMPEFKPFDMPIMPPILPMKPMEPFTIDPIEIENHVPDKDSHYQGVVVSSYSHSEDINGKKTCGGGSTKVVNVDGEVEKKEVHYGQGDKD